jgi:hypothetical protein
MDTIRSYKTLIAASVVNAELFPDIALGDAPILSDSSVNMPVSISVPDRSIKAGGK